MSHSCLQGPWPATSVEPRGHTGDCLVPLVPLQLSACLAECQGYVPQTRPECLPPLKVSPVAQAIPVWLLQVLSQIPQALEVIPVDKGIRGLEAFVVLPAGPQDHWYSPGFQSILSRLLCDVIRVEGVLKCQIKLVSGQSLHHVPFREPHMSLAIHIHVEATPRHLADLESQLDTTQSWQRGWSGFGLEAPATAPASHRA